MSKRQQQRTAYGLSDAILNVPLLPVVSTRVPATNDVTNLGSLWVNKSADSAYILTKIASNAATWTEFTDQEGEFLEFELTTHNANIDAIAIFDIPPSSAVTMYATIIGARADYSAAACGMFELGGRRFGIANAVATGAGVESFDEDTGGGNVLVFSTVVPDFIALAVQGEAAAVWNWKAQITIVRLPL